MVQPLNLPTSRELDGGIVKILDPNADVFDKCLAVTIQELDTSEWANLSFREPEFITDGVSIVHNHYGNTGRYKATSALFRYGFRAYARDCESELDQIVADHYQRRAHKDTVERPKLTHTRNLDGKRWLAIEPQMNGRLADHADGLGLDKSTLIRHYIAAALAHAARHGSVDLGYVADVAQEYETALDTIIENANDH